MLGFGFPFGSLRSRRGPLQKWFQQSGQLVIVIPMCLAMTIGGSLLWGYMNVLRAQDASVKAGMDMNTMAHAILRRVESNLLRRNPVSAAPTECTTAVLDRFAQYRDIGTQAPSIGATLTETFHVDVSTSGTLDTVPCLLMADEEKRELSMADISISRIGDPDTAAGASSVQVSVEVRSRMTEHRPIQKRALLTRKYALQMASLTSYNVVFREIAATVATPKISVPSTAVLEITGPVLDLASIPYDIRAFAPLNGTVEFDQRVDMRAPSMTVATDSYDIASSKLIYKGGMNLGVMPEVTRFPFSEADLTSAAWNTKFDWTFVYNYFPVGGDLGFPMPKLNDLPGLTDMFYIQAPATDNLFYGGGKSPLPVAFPGAGAISDALANFNAIPDATVGIPSLSDTCSSPGGSGHETAFVRTRPSDDLAMTFTAGDNIFCGYIATRDLNITTPATGTFAILGYILARRITVTGGGRVVIMFPPLNATVPGITFPISQISENNDNLLPLANSLAFNFFVPVSVPGTSDLSTTFRNQNASFYTEPCGGVLSDYAPINPNTGREWCRKAITPPPYADLFPPTRAFNDDIAFTLSVRQ